MTHDEMMAVHQHTWVTRCWCGAYHPADAVDHALQAEARPGSITGTIYDKGLLAEIALQRARAEQAEAKRDEYKALAAVGPWHNDCRPNRHKAAEELQKSQAIINKLADRIQGQGYAFANIASAARREIARLWQHDGDESQQALTLEYWRGVLSLCESMDEATPALDSYRETNRDKALIDAENKWLAVSAERDLLHATTGELAARLVQAEQERDALRLAVEKLRALTVEALKAAED